MQELINKVAANAGITTEQATKAIETVQASLKEKMPFMMHQHIDTILNGGGMTDAFKKQIQDFSDETESAFKDFKERGEKFAEEMKDKWKKNFGA